MFKIPVVVFTDSTSVEHLKVIFGMTLLHFSYPEEIVSNNDPPFRSEEITCYILKYPIKYRHVTLYWPRANGKIKKLMISLTKAIITAMLVDKPYLSEVDNFLIAYRVTLQTTTTTVPHIWK